MNKQPERLPAVRGSLVRRARMAVVRHPGRSAAVIAMMSILLLSQGYGQKLGTGGGGEPAPPQPPNPPNVPAVTVNPTDTSVLATSSAFSGDVGDTHDQTIWQIDSLVADFSTPLWADTTIDSLTSYQGAGAGASVPLAVGTQYKIRANHHGSVSAAWSGFGSATNFTTSSGGAPAAVHIFESQWDNSTGTANTATSDGGKWSIGGSSPGLGNIEVVTAASQGIIWPTANALLVQVDADLATNGRFPFGDFWTAPAVGDSLYYRWYTRCVVPDTIPDLTLHPIQNEPSVSATTWQWQVFTNPTDPAGTCDMKFDFKGTSEVWYGPDAWIAKDSTMRWELKIRRTGAGTARYDARVYYVLADSSETLAFGSANFCKRNGNGADPTGCIAGTLADEPSITTANVSNLDGLVVGVNGWDYAGVAFKHHYQGAVLVCRVTWCGQYTAGEGP